MVGQIAWKCQALASRVKEIVDRAVRMNGPVVNARGTGWNYLPLGCCLPLSLLGRLVIAITTIAAVTASGIRIILILRCTSPPPIAIRIVRLRDTRQGPLQTAPIE